MRQFILVTSDYSGLGFALLEKYENQSQVLIAFQPKEPVEKNKQKAYDVLGRGLIPKVPLSEIMRGREAYRHAYFIWDGNHNIKENAILRHEGFKVFGSSEFTFRLENDRDYGMRFAKSLGFDIPDFKEFSSDGPAVAHLKKNPDTAYVFKPSGSSDAAMTQPFLHTPEGLNANQECQSFIRAIFPQLQEKTFILQERKKGVEVNVEVFCARGEPVLAQANLEAKMKENDGLGIPTGCAFDVCWKLPLDAPLVAITIGKAFNWIKKNDFTGFADVNCIIGEDQTEDTLKVWFIEWCWRTGYNAHPNFFQTLAKKTYLQTVADLIDGKKAYASAGFGASVTLHCDREKIGLPIYIPETIKKQVYLFDCFKEKEDASDEFSMGGFGNEIAIAFNHDFDMASALQGAVDTAFKIKFAGRGFRTDAAKRDIINAPLKRFEALTALNLC